MTLMDDLKKTTEEGLKTLKETAGEIAFNVEKQAKIAKRKMDIMKTQRKIQKLYTEIGEYVYGEFTMQRPLTMEVPFLAERMASVAKIKSEIREIEAEIEEMRKLQPPAKRVHSVMDYVLCDWCLMTTEPAELTGICMASIRDLFRSALWTQLPHPGCGRLLSPHILRC